MRTNKYLDRMGKLKLWGGLIGGQNLQREAESHYRNREAEEAHVRKNVWGATEQSQDDDDMGNTQLGDNYYPPPVVVPQSQSNNIVPTLLIAAASALAGYALSKPTTVVPVSPPTEMPGFDDETLKIGLGKIEDYLNE